MLLVGIDFKLLTLTSCLVRNSLVWQIYFNGSNETGIKAKQVRRLTGKGEEPEEEGAEDDDERDGVDGVLGDPEAAILSPRRVGERVVRRKLVLLRRALRRDCGRRRSVYHLRMVLERERERETERREKNLFFFLYLVFC